MKSQTMTLSLLVFLVGNVCAEDPKPPTLPAKQSTGVKAGKVKPEAKSPSAKSEAPRANDQLTLDSTVVTGNRELPKVMYIVPWKKADLSNLPGQPFNTLIDETLAPVDREVFRREVAYYDVVAGKDHGVTTSAPEMQATPSADRK